jgi:ribonuclease Y
VERAFAIQAGRELRVVVKPEEVDDQASLRMARELARRIEEELLYPGQIRITVVRETRCVEYAK